MRFFAGETANESTTYLPARKTLMPHSNQTTPCFVNHRVSAFQADIDPELA
jgi:hypothetical protein